MDNLYSLKIDAYSHISPKKYEELLPKEREFAFRPHLLDLERRFRIMDEYKELVQVLTLATPPVEKIADPKKAVELAKLANDGMAELVYKYPERFIAAIACLPMNNVDAALKEVDRAINELKFKGVLIYSHINDKPLDSPEFLPLFEKMSQHNLPIFIHPDTGITYADYKSESKSKYLIDAVFGWPYETTVAMTRIVFSGILEKYPNLKIVTHHCGAMVPYFADRLTEFHDFHEVFNRDKDKLGLTKSPIEYFKMFFNDTALYGNTPALMCAYKFFGADHLLFGTDFPLCDSQQGYRRYRESINAIEQMDISDLEKKMIFADNARTLMRLPI